MTRWTCAAAALILCACGGGEKKAGAPADQAAPPAIPAFTAVDPATAAAITGKAVLKGKKPVMPVIQMNEEAACVRLHKGSVRVEEVVAGADGSLANVFVYVKTGLEGKAFEPAKEPVSIDQRGCMFRPHVLGIRTGQTLLVLNSDPVSHNIHPMPKDNREWNQGQAPQAANLEREFARAEIMIPVKCNVHSWMKSYIGVLDHPYFAVTGAQGAFDLKNLPPGEYTVAAWHEKYGTVEKKVTLAAAASPAVEFVFGEQP